MAAWPSSRQMVSGQSGIAYGAIVDGAKFQTAVQDSEFLAQATSAIAQQMSEQNGGMQQGAILQR